MKTGRFLLFLPVLLILGCFAGFVRAKLARKSQNLPVEVEKVGKALLSLPYLPSLAIRAFPELKKTGRLLPQFCNPWKSTAKTTIIDYIDA